MKHSYLFWNITLLTWKVKFHQGLLILGSKHFRKLQNPIIVIIILVITIIFIILSAMVITAVEVFRRHVIQRDLRESKKISVKQISKFENLRIDVVLWKVAKCWKYFKPLIWVNCALASSHHPSLKVDLNPLKLERWTGLKKFRWMLTLSCPTSTFVDFTLSIARRFYSSMGNPLGRKGLISNISSHGTSPNIPLGCEDASIFQLNLPWCVTESVCPCCFYFSFSSPSWSKISVGINQ